MTIHDKRERCARRMGWTKVVYDPEVDSKLGPCFLPYFQNEYGNGVINVALYHPDLSDAASLKQADELWHKLESDGMQCDVESWTNPDRQVFKILIIKCKFRYWYVKGSGSWWNSALVDAVSRMEVDDAS